MLLGYTLVPPIFLSSLFYLDTNPNISLLVYDHDYSHPPGGNYSEWSLQWGS